MKLYRVKMGFSVDYDYVLIYFCLGQIWGYVGESHGFIRLNRDDIFVDVSRDLINRHFEEIGEEE